MAEADPKMSVSVADLRANLSFYLKKAAAGASFTIMSRGKPVAVLVPDVEPAESRSRAPGAMKGQIWIANDFDDPLPDEVLNAFEAGL